MAQVALERILQEITTLEPEELLQVQQAIQARLAAADSSPESVTAASQAGTFSLSWWRACAS
jgi:hypothetical protein